MSFEFKKLSIPEVVLVTNKNNFDDRGQFTEIFRCHDFDTQNIGGFVQENVSISKKGVLRGLHFQAAPREAGKLVACLQGLIFDVALDIRPKSPTFGKHVHAWLAGASQALWIPPGFAHGFYAVLDSVVLYRQTQYYEPELNRIIRWNSAGIWWPMAEEVPIMSQQDYLAPLLETLYKC